MRLILAFALGLLTLSTPAFSQVKDLVNGVYTPGFRSVPNYIKNPSCFANTKDTSTSGGGAIARSTSSPLEGVASCSISSTTAAGYVRWNLKTLDNVLSGRNCEVIFSYSSTTASNWKVYVYNTTDSVKVSQELTLTDTVSGQSKEGYFAFPCGDLSDTYVLQAEALATPTSAAKISRIDYGLMTRMVQSSVVSEWRDFTPTGSWSSNATYTGKWRQVGENMEIDVTVSTSGAPTASTLSVNLPSGYTIDTSKLTGGTSQLATIFSQLTVNDSGSSFKGPGAVSYNNSTSVILRIVDASSTYGTMSGVSQVVPITFGAGDSVNAIFTIPVQQFNGATQSIVAPSQSDYGWATWSPISVGSQGFGTIAAESCFHSRKGQNLLLQCKFTAGTIQTSAPRITLPGSLTVSSTAVPTIRVAGQWWRSNGGAAAKKRGTVLMTGGDAFIAFSVDHYDDNTNPLVALTNAQSMFTNSDVIFFEAEIPIQGWLNPSVITASLVGTVQTGSIVPERIERASITNSGTPAVGSQSGSWISSITDGGVGLPTINIAAGVFSAAPSCTVLQENGWTNKGTFTSTALPLTTKGNGGSNADVNFDIMCMGPR